MTEARHCTNCGTKLSGRGSFCESCRISDQRTSDRTKPRSWRLAIILGLVCAVLIGYWYGQRSDGDMDAIKARIASVEVEPSPTNDRLKALEYEAKIAADTATELEKAAFLELTNLPSIGVMNPRDQYEIVTRQSLGTIADRPTVVMGIDSNYRSILGRYVLQNLMEIDITDTTTPREYFHQFVARGFTEPDSKFFDQTTMDKNWARLVEYSKDLSDPAPEGDEEIVGRVIAMSDVWQIAAAKAKSGITGPGIYPQLFEQVFDGYVERYEGERAFATGEDWVGFAAWLDKNVGGRWAVDKSRQPGASGKETETTATERVPVPTATPGRHLGQYEREIQDYDEAIRLNPQLAEAYYNRGIAYHNLGQYQRAIEDYDEARGPEATEKFFWKNARSVYRWPEGT